MKLGKWLKKIKLQTECPAIRKRFPKLRPKAWDHIKYLAPRVKGKGARMGQYRKSYVNGIFKVTKLVTRKEGDSPVEVVIFTCDTSTYGQSVWLQACGHGIGQKFGDSYAGKDMDDETVRMKCQEIHDTLSSGQWNKKAGGSEPKLSKANLKAGIEALDSDEAILARKLLAKLGVTL
jgi:hypothetical protein